MFQKFILILIKYFQGTNAVFLKVEKIKIPRDSHQFCAAILIYFSKAFDCIRYNLLIAKLNAYDQEVSKIIHSYLCDRSQKFKVWVLHLATN